MIKNNNLVSVDEARQIIGTHAKPGNDTVIIPVRDAPGYVIAQTIRSPYPSPPFHQSAMDGYALRFKDHLQHGELTLQGESVAGTGFAGTVKRGHAIRIFTGASLPKGTDTVVIQEKVRVSGQSLVIADDSLSKGANIRRAGSQLKKGAVAIRKGSLLNPGAVAFLASLGINRIRVYRKPTAAIIITGSELVAPGGKLNEGQIFESNSTALAAMLHHDGIPKVTIQHVTDNYTAIRKAFVKAVKHHDFILFTGGISVGDYDFVRKVVKDENVRTLFYKIRQKPGKPLYFGKAKDRYVFGLPGNPASVITCYHEFVRPAMKKFFHHPAPFPVPLRLPLRKPVLKKTGLVHFLRAATDFQTVEVLPGQESYKLQSFVQGNCLVMLRETDGDQRQGDWVEIHLL